MEKTKGLIIGSDHRGFAMKKFLIGNTQIDNVTITWHDVGAFNNVRCDYPFFAIQAVKDLKNGIAQGAILICGNGIGMAITANRFRDIFAGVAWSNEIARTAKEDDNINVLVLPSDFVSNNEALTMINIWLKAEFKKGRYQERIDMINKI